MSFAILVYTFLLASAAGGTGWLRYCLLHELCAHFIYFFIFISSHKFLGVGEAQRSQLAPRSSTQALPLQGEGKRGNGCALILYILIINY
jgi:hypothetical protein